MGSHGARSELEPRAVAWPIVFAASFAFILVLHLPLLTLPYFWDEAGYYIPAARDLFLSGKLIPHSTPSNAHPPLVMAYVAAAWKIAGYSLVTTRIAMLLAAALSLTGLFRLAETVSNRAIAWATILCTALYPVFFVQSSLAQVDLTAAGFTFWGLAAYARNRARSMAIWMTLAALTKETAILAPAALLAWSFFRTSIHKNVLDEGLGIASDWRHRLALLCPMFILAAWYAYHYHMTGYMLGNPEYFRYNVQSTLSPIRFVLAFGFRLWQTFGYLQLWLLTAAMAIAMFLRPRQDNGVARNRIAIPLQMSFFAVIAAYILFMSAVGGAVLARYMLPVVPLVILIAISTLWRRARHWMGVSAVVVLGFISALFWPPPYGFSLEDNLAYREYIVMHRNAARFLQSHHPEARILTAWPASDEVTRPYLGYVDRPLREVRIEDFSLEQVMSASDLRRSYDVALVFSTKYQPVHPLFARWQAWQDLKTRYFGYHRDLPPQAIAQILGGNLEFEDVREGQWIAVIALERIEDARLQRPLYADIK